MWHEAIQTPTANSLQEFGWHVYAALKSETATISSTEMSRQRKFLFPKHLLQDLVLHCHQCVADIPFNVTDGICIWRADHERIIHWRNTLVYESQASIITFPPSKCSYISVSFHIGLIIQWEWVSLTPRFQHAFLSHGNSQEGVDLLYTHPYYLYYFQEDLTCRQHFRKCCAFCTRIAWNSRPSSQQHMSFPGVTA